MYFLTANICLLHLHLFTFIFFRANFLLSKRPIIALVFFFFGFFLVKFGISYILAGSSGLTFLGQTYSSIALSTLTESEKYIHFFSTLMMSLKGHISIIVLLYSLPLALAISITTKIFLTKKTNNTKQDLEVIQYEKFAFLSLVIILNLIFITALFTAMAVNTGPYETPYRIHMRYYNFSLPLFYIIAAGSFSKVIHIDKYIRCLIGAIFVILCIYTIQSNLAPYTLSFLDSPEVFGIHKNHVVFVVMGIFVIIALFSWIFFERKGILQYFYFLLPLFVCVSSYNVGSQLNKQKDQNSYGKAGIISKMYIPAEDISKTIVVGSDLGNLFSTLFYLDNSKISFDFIPENSTYDLSKLNRDKEWILLIGQHDLIGKSFYQIPLNGFSLINVSKIINLDFRVNNWPIISRAKGLSSPESWGTWSNSSVVEFKFNFPLPKKFELHLVASAFGPNVGAEVSVKSGSITKKVTLSENGRLQVLLFENKEKSNSLVFVIPKATSPKDLGLGEDTRKLGIGFVQIKIVAI